MWKRRTDRKTTASSDRLHGVTYPKARLLIVLAGLFLWSFSTGLPAADDPDLATDGEQPQVLVKTNLGNFEITLYPEKSPKSVENFLDYVDAGFYDGTVFHRVIRDFVVQGGMYTQELESKPTQPPIPIEADNDLSNLRGTVAVARAADPDSGTSQFFINLVDNHRLDFVNKDSGLTWGYTVFGKVTSGMDVIDAIGEVPTRAQGPFTADVPSPLVIIESASVVQPQDAGTDAEDNADTSDSNS